MDLLRTSYKDFLISVKDIYYKNFDDDQRIIMTRIMYKLKSWLLKSRNIGSFTSLYGFYRLYEINILWYIYKLSTPIKNEYYVDLYDGFEGTFALDFVKYIMNHDIHSDITIDIIYKYLDTHDFRKDSMFFGIIASHEGADAIYYLTLLEEFGNDSYIVENIYKNMNDKELFVIEMFKHIKSEYIEEFLHNVDISSTQKVLDVFISNILSNKYNNDTGYILYIFEWFEYGDIEISYDELVCSKNFVEMCKENLNIMPKDICDIISEFSRDDLDFLTYAIKKQFTYNSGTIKLAIKNGNIKCAKYMKKK